MIHAFASILAVLTLVGGPEIPLSDPVIGPRPGVRSAPRVATNGEDYLIVWAEVGEIRAARVDDEGRVLDASGIRVASGTGTALSVASDGRDYVIAYDCAGNVSPAGKAICTARVDAATGHVRPGGRLALAANPAIASANGRYLVVYQTTYLGSLPQAYGIEVGDDAALIGEPFQISAVADRPEIASNGKDYFVIWSVYAHLKGVLIRGREIAGPEQTITFEWVSWGPGPFSWSVGSNGDAFMVVWQQNIGLRNNAYMTELRAAPITGAGFLEPQKRTTLVTGDQPTWNPQITWDGASYAVTYTVSPLRATAPYLGERGASDIHELRLNANAEVVTPPSTVAAREGGEAFSSAASNGTSTLIAWERLLRTDVATIEATLSHSAPLAIPVSASAQQNLAGADATVAWEEILGEEQKRTLFVRRLQEGGRGTPVAASEKHQVLPALSRSFITWIERDFEQKTAEVFAKRPFTNEQPSRLGDAERTSPVAIAETSSDALAVWVSPQQQIVGAWIQRGGAPFVISSEGRLHNPIVTTDGENFLVVWGKEEPCAIFCLWTSLHASVVTSSGVVQPAIELAEEPVSNASAVWNGNEYVVFWNQRGVNARRMQRSGLPIGATIEVRKDMFANNVIWNGREYLVAVTGSLGFAPLTAARLDRDLRLIDFAAISNTYVGGTRVVLLDGWIAYQSRTADGISRAVARTLDLATVGKRRSAR
ncbi:MAG TPA: hypothetical protein VKB93_11335 [Thermoanaerobaculia bacterium]|nr:hypothetical protein [Thermoanaerobaculia bacterium]